jgi:hypothetical protein
VQEKAVKACSSGTDGHSETDKAGAEYLPVRALQVYEQREQPLCSHCAARRGLSCADECTECARERWGDGNGRSESGA